MNEWVFWSGVLSTVTKTKEDLMMPLRLASMEHNQFSNIYPVLIYARYWALLKELIKLKGKQKRQNNKKNATVISILLVSYSGCNK